MGEALEECLRTIEKGQKKERYPMSSVSVAELQELEEKIAGLVAEIPGPGDALEWVILEAELYEMYIELANIGERSIGEVKWQIFNARHFVLRTMRSCEERVPLVKHTAGEAAYCLNQAWHVLQDGDVSEPE